MDELLGLADLLPSQEVIAITRQRFLNPRLSGTVRDIGLKYALDVVEEGNVDEAWQFVRAREEEGINCDDLPPRSNKAQRRRTPMVTPRPPQPLPPRMSNTDPKPPGPVRTPTKSPPKNSNDNYGFLGRPAIAGVVFGPSGVGKTSFGAEFEKTGFIIDPQEDGINDLVEYKQCKKPEEILKVTNWEKLLSTCADIANRKYDIRTAVFDSTTGFEKLCFQYHCRMYFDNDWSAKGFYSYQKGPKNAAKTDWPQFLDALNGIRESGINVILLGHSTVKQFSNPEGSDYDRYIPYLDGETWQQTHRWAQFVLFYNYHVSVEKKEGVKKKADIDNEKRFLYTVRTAAFDAKNRHGLPPLIEAGTSGKEAYDRFVAEFSNLQ